MIVDARLTAARNELARTRAELADTKAEVETWRETVAVLEARALEVDKAVSEAEARERRILAACAELPSAIQAAIQAAINNVLTTLSEK